MKDFFTKNNWKVKDYRDKLVIECDTQSERDDIVDILDIVFNLKPKTTTWDSVTIENFERKD